jgi:acetoin utilization deacetylase AcuC-like enzyme
VDVFFDPVFLKHDTGYHPENMGRLRLLLDYLKESKSGIIKPSSGEAHLLIAHAPEYIERVRRMSQEGGGFLDLDTPVSRDTYEAAVKAVGASVDASKKGGFALVRPPGHHAFRDRGSGFCIFNNMAIAAMKNALEGKRVFILDIDVHHGNGTEEIVLMEPNIKFVSIHQSPLYPGTGLTHRKHDSLNLTLAPGSGDREFIKHLETVDREMKTFDPDVIGVSVGFDAYHLDQGWVAGNALQLTPKSYHAVKELLKPYKTFYVLEGGYNPKSILEGCRALMDL